MNKALFSSKIIESCEFAVISKIDFGLLLETNENFIDWFYQTALIKLVAHSKRLLSFIVNNPQ
jgi:hypothetical protein